MFVDQSECTGQSTAQFDGRSNPMPSISRGPGFWLQPQLAGKTPEIDPDPTHCYYCSGKNPNPAVGYVNFNYSGTDQWYWRYGVCQDCIDKKRSQARPGIDLIFYDKGELPEQETEVVEPAPLEPEPAVQADDRGQCALF
jgi:hypothetical protein